MTTWMIRDWKTGEDYEVPGVIVHCQTPGCENEGVRIEVADDGNPVVCGPCGAFITDTLQPA